MLQSETNKKIVKIDDDEDNSEENIIIIYEKVNLETAGRIWECSLILGRYLIKQAYFNKIQLNNKSILDLGCGTGILSLMLAKQGANVWATDLSLVEVLCDQNIKKNKLENKIVFKLLDWTQSKHKTECLIDQKQFDIIVASDPIYNQKTCDSFFNQLKIIVEYAKNQPLIYLAYKKRHEEIDRIIEDQIESIGLWFKLIDNQQLDDQSKNAQCVIYKIGKYL